MTRRKTKVTLSKEQLEIAVMKQNDLAFKTHLLMELLYKMPTAYINMIVEEFYYKYVYDGPTYYYVRHRATGEEHYYALERDVMAFQYRLGATKALKVTGKNKHFVVRKVKRDGK